MGDYSIKARFEAACPTRSVMACLDRPEGIARWWSDTADGAAGAVGDRFQVTFPTTPVIFKLEVEAISDAGVAWGVPESPPWWRGTTIRFDLADADAGRSTIEFTHGGFEPGDPIIPVITPAWVRFLDNLVAVAESGEANPSVVN